VSVSGQRAVYASVDGSAVSQVVLTLVLSLRGVCLFGKWSKLLARAEFAVAGWLFCARCVCTCYNIK
jgi:hypothetical protein